MNTELFCISEGDSVKNALAKIQDNQYGFILTTDAECKVNALATDGDIRSMLLKGLTLESRIGDCANKNFVWADQHTSREMLLKQLDHKIRMIPILDEHRHLIEVVSRDRMPIRAEEKIYSRARAPVRISFGGGGSDLTHYFAGDQCGAVINSTISLYSHATLRVRDDKKIAIHSRDLNDSLYADNLDDALSQMNRFGLIQALLKAVQPEFGFELFLHSDFPMNSGLGGSAVVAAVVLGCFNEFRTDKWDSHELAELAFQAERLYLNVAGGWQDQYATVFGGFNFMEFRMDQNIVHPLRVKDEILSELEESLVLCNTGTDHNSGDIHRDQKLRMSSDDVNYKVRTNVELTYRMRNYLLRGRLREFGEAMNDTWHLKRQFSSGISNPRLDGIYELAMAHGAIGGKLLGAGGGGFFLFYVQPFDKHGLMNVLEEAGLEIKYFRFEHCGLRSWSARETKNHVEK